MNNPELNEESNKSEKFYERICNRFLKWWDWYVIGEIAFYLILIPFAYCITRFYRGESESIWSFENFTFTLFLILPALLIFAFVLIFESLPLEYLRSRHQIHGLVDFDFDERKTYNIDETKGYKLYEHKSKKILIHLDEDCKDFNIFHENLNIPPENVYRSLNDLEYRIKRLTNKNLRYHYFQFLSMAYVTWIKISDAKVDVDEKKSKSLISFVNQALKYLLVEELNLIRKYEIYGAITAIVFFVFFGVCKDFLDCCFFYYDFVTVNNIILFSILGGSFSVFYTAIPKATKALQSLKISDNFFNGFIRIAIGVLGGFIIHILIKGNFLFGFIEDDKSPFTLYCLYIVAGYSSNFVIERLKKTEDELFSEKDKPNQSAANDNKSMNGKT